MLPGRDGSPDPGRPLPGDRPISRRRSVRGLLGPWHRGDFGHLDARGEPQRKEVVAMTRKTKRKTKRRTFAQGRGYTKRDWDDVSHNPQWTKAGD